MAVQALDIPQRRYVNESVLPMLEVVVREILRWDDFLAQYAAQQNAIATTPTDLGNGANGTVPRDDVPVLTGTQLGAIRDNIAQMRATVTDAELNTLISLLGRPLSNIREG